jgi:dihydrofolate reductase
MPNVRVNSFAVSLDGFAAGPQQSLEHPLGVRGLEIFDPFIQTRVWRSMNNLEGGETGVDNEMAERSFAGVGAYILGRNMFGPVRGPWPDESWRGWWGENPPYHVPTFVLTHYPRPPLEMQGGTTFHFVTDGIEAALAAAKAAAGEKDVRVGGGVSTVQQFFRAGLVDEMHLALRPVLLGEGENLWHGIDLHALGYKVDEHINGERAVHVFIRRR